MARYKNEIMIILALGSSILFTAAGCQSAKLIVGNHPTYDRGPSFNGGPPPWAPAHGCKAKHRYLYYPSSYVYFDVGRQLYFYYNVGQWRVSATIPTGIRIDLDDHVTLEMATDKPYRFHEEVVKRHPPGHRKHKHKGKSKGKRKGIGAS